MKNISLLIMLFSIVNLINGQEKNEKNNLILKVNLIKEKLNISSNDFNAITQDDLIVDSLYHSIIDSIETQNIQRHLDSFLLKKYDAKRLMLALEMERKMESNESFKFSDKISPENSLNFKSVDEFLKWKKEFHEKLERENGMKFINDSLNKN